jgi:hypothetical protein
VFDHLEQAEQPAKSYQLELSGPLERAAPPDRLELSDLPGHSEQAERP